MTHVSETTPIALWYGNADAGTVEQVEAFPRIRDSYWVPTRGCMLSKGHQLFDTYGEALAEAKATVARKIDNLQKTMRKLEKL